MAAVVNGHTNGVNGHAAHRSYERFSAVPESIDIPVQQDENEAVSIDLNQLEVADIDELCALLESENAARNYWITIALAYVKVNKADNAIDILKRALEALQHGRAEDKLSILTCLCWLYLWKCRRAPRLKPTQTVEDDRLKDHWLSAATGALNEASKISPSYAPLFLARGGLHLLRASLQIGEKPETLRQALKCFEDANRSSGGKNLFAVLGRARTQFSMGKYADAYTSYQQVLERAPDMNDPDPRVGIGCCLWQLGHKDNAKDAWERSLQINPNSTIANILLGLYHLDRSTQYNSNDPEFAPIYKKAMTTFTQTAFKLDDMHALTCSTFGSYFLLRKAWANVERLAKRAIERTDLSAIASDGWYLLARKEHYEGDFDKALEFYGKADQARSGYIPAKFGIAQVKILTSSSNSLLDAKHQLEKMLSTSKSVEAMTLLGVLHAEDVFASRVPGSKDDKINERKKAIGLLEQVRVAWKDSKKKIQPDSAVLLNLARLYESEQPDKALACLQQVEQMELDDLPDDELPEDLTDPAVVKTAKREMLSPQLLNNIGCFHFQADKMLYAREYFQAALNSSVSINQKDSSVDTDTLVSSISYNLARTYEAEGLEEESMKIYQGLLDRHPDYIDAKTRLAYISLRSQPEKGSKAVKQLLESTPENLEVRSLYGWYVHRNKKRTLAIQEDFEQRHFKYTLQTYDKHDTYSLTGMGNLHLVVARETPRDTDQHKERRSTHYIRAVEFFDKVLTLDPKNAFAAQGMGIAMVEEKKDTSAAIQIFTKVRESIKDASVHINLGHVFCEVKQFSRSIENYELALQKSREKDPQILACLGRVWLLRGRSEKNIDHYKQSLEFSQQALMLAPDSVNFKFNVAFVQIQIAQQMISQPEQNKTVEGMEKAYEDLDAAIESFIEIARSPHPPFPKNDIEQRANMGKNTMKRQLASAKDKQVEYERKNASRLEEARKRRDAEVQKREDEKRTALEKAEAEKRKIREERERMMEEDRQLIQRRLEEDRMREAADYTTDEETGERRRREKKPKEKRQKRKKKSEESDSDGDGAADATGDEGDKKSRPQSGMASATASDGEGSRKKKKRRLERKGTAVKSSKFKSAETIEDSDEDDDAGLQPAVRSDDVETPGASSTPAPVDGDMVDDGDGDGDDEEEQAVSRSRKKRVLDDDEEDEEASATNGVDISMADDDVVAAGESDHGGD